MDYHATLPSRLAATKEYESGPGDSVNRGTDSAQREAALDQKLSMAKKMSNGQISNGVYDAFDILKQLLSARIDQEDVPNEELFYRQLLE